MANAHAVTDTMLPEVIDAGSGRTATSIISVVWQRKSLVILGVVIGLVGGSLFYAQRQPIYESRASVHVVNKSVNPGGSTSSKSVTTTFVDDYMSTQKQIMGSEIIAQLAANKDKIKKKLAEDGFRSFPDAKKPDDLILGIRTSLIVSRDMRESGGGNNILLLQFRGTDREDCKLILEAMIEAYNDHITDVFRDLSENLVKAITQTSKELDDKIKQADEDLKKFYDHSPHLISSSSGGMSSAKSKMVILNDMISKAEVDLSLHQTNLDNFVKINKQGPEKLIQYLAMANKPIPQLTGDPESDKQLLKLKVEEIQLLTMYGPEHPVVKINRQHQKALRDIVRSKDKSGKTNEETTFSGNTTEEMAEMFLGALRLEIDSLVTRLTTLKIEHAASSKEMRELIQSETKQFQLQDARARAVSQHAEIQKLISNADLKSANSGGFRAYATDRPGIGFKISPMPFQIFTAATLLGLLLGVGLAYLAEISDKSFRSPAEIRKRLGLPVIGHVPFMAADEKAAAMVAAGTATLDPMLVTHYQSNSIGAEAYRGVRTALYFSTQGAGHQVIQVTSPNVSDGKSTLAANLAVSIAQSGKRTLLIDADFRKPRVHKIFNVPAQVGMASVMAGQCDLGSAAQQTAIPNLSVMPCGPRPVNPAELLTSPKFKDLLEELRHQYDFVIVDTPPILVVTDPAVVAPRVDGVVLCIRVTKNGRPYAERAREVLQSLGANVLGVVVNGFGATVGGNKYGYEHYNYGYGEGYSYTYGYTYGYADKEAASYYGNTADEPHSNVPAIKG